MSDPIAVVLNPAATVSSTPPSTAPAAVTSPRAAGAPGAAGASGPAGRGDLLAKAEFESRMLARPDDAGLRAGYFELLGRLTSQHTGLLYVLLPEIGAPLYVRAGTPDLAALTQALNEATFAPDLRATPQRILLIGGHAGYSAVALARRHPRAELLVLEPLEDNARLLTLNTQAWRRIRVGQIAVWHGATRVAPHWRLMGDWTVRLTDEAMDEDRTIPTLSPDEVLTRFGWSHADMVVCDAAGAEREIFADSLAPWLRRLDVALIRVHDNLAQNAGASVAACFPLAQFDVREHAGMKLYERQAPFTALPPTPPELFLFGSEPGLTRASAAHVAPHSCFTFGGGDFQLVPNPPGTPPARVSIPLTLAGHRRLVSGIHHAGHLAGAPGPVVARAWIETPEGHVLASAEATVAPRADARLMAELAEPYHGPVRVVLETEMAGGATDNRMAWARFIAPRVG